MSTEQFIFILGSKHLFLCIPMSINCTHLVANLFLSYRDRDFVLSYFRIKKLMLLDIQDLHPDNYMAYPIMVRQKLLHDAPSGGLYNGMHQSL